MSTGATSPRRVELKANDGRGNSLNPPATGDSQGDGRASRGKGDRPQKGKAKGKGDRKGRKGKGKDGRGKGGRAKGQRGGR